MPRSSRRSTRSSRILLAWFTLAAFVAACASLPPAKPVTSVRQIAGTWQGTGYGPRGAGPVRQTINSDGSYSAVVASGTFTGKITSIDGTLRGKSDQTGTTGTYSLHEGVGKRVLVYKSDDGRVTAELTPAK
jgi:hypothetical protein